MEAPHTQFTTKNFPKLQPHEVRFLQGYTRQPGRIAVLSGLFDAKDYERMQRGRLGEFLGGVRELSDGFFKACASLAELYIELHPRSFEHTSTPRLESVFLQLSLLIERQVIVTDPRFIPVLERMAKVATRPAIASDPFVEGMMSWAKLKEGITLDFARAVPGLAASGRLWEGPFGRIFFFNIANAVEVLSRNHPDETMEARIALLRECWRNQDARLEIEWTIGKSFTRAGERRALFAKSQAETHDARLKQLLLKLSIEKMDGRRSETEMVDQCVPPMN
jgi:hypothetical protein